MKTAGLLATLTLSSFSFFAGCSKNNSNNTTTPPDAKCVSDKFTLTYTDILDVPSAHMANLTFDIKNTSTEDYDIVKGYKPVYVRIAINTTNNKTYYFDGPLTTSLGAGETESETYPVDYGAGNAYKDFKIEKVYCK